MNLRDLSYFIALAEHRHFGRAADACCVSQPTLSGQIRKLEEFLGVTLFERTNRSVEITPIGRTLVDYARRAVEQADLMTVIARAHRGPLAGPLRLGVIPTLGPYLMPLVLAPLRERYPQMRLILLEDITDHLLHQLRRHDIDCALIATPVDDEDLQTWPLFDEPFWLAHPRRHALSGKAVIGEADLPRDELLLLADGHCLSRQMMDICRLAEPGADSLVGDLRAAGLETLMQLVGAGLGCTLAPALVLCRAWSADSGIMMRPLRMDTAFRRIRLVSRKTFPRSVALHALMTLLIQQLPDTVKPLALPETVA